MEFSLGRDTLPSQARSVRGESRRLRRGRDNAKTLIRCPLRRVAQRDHAEATRRPAFSAIWRTAADAKSVHDHLSRHHAGPKIERACFDIDVRTCAYAPAAQNEQSPPRASVCLRLPLPPRATAGRSGTDHFHGQARSRLTGNSQQPQSRRYHSNQVITQMNMCDDVSVNMSLYGNERETPSIRSRTIFEIDDSS